MPRPRRSHAAHRARRLARDAVVPRLPSRPGAAPSTARAGVRHGPGAATAKPAPSSHAAHDRLLHMPQIKITRRDFLKFSAASAALATGACSRPSEPIVPYAHQPENELPGVPRFYASAVSFLGAAEGVLVESNTGRPTKVEGNPAHPGSLGATSVHGQAAVLGLWDPDRSKAPRRGGQP